jgi:hypothetical protein
LHWRADFDWTGLRIVGAAITSLSAQPWRMTAADYRNALETGDSTPLMGSPAASPWDPELAALLSGHGRAVMEERLMPVLLTDLTHRDPDSILMRELDGTMMHLCAQP